MDENRQVEIAQGEIEQNDTDALDYNEELDETRESMAQALEEVEEKQQHEKRFARRDEIAQDGSAHDDRGVLGHDEELDDIKEAMTQALEEVEEEQRHEERLIGQELDARMEGTLASEAN
jgi:hypothetical protein